MLSFSPDQLITTALAAICIGLAKGGFGGAGMLAVLLMAQVFPARESTGAILPMLIIGDVVAVRLYHAHARAAVILRLLPPAAVGIIAGWLLMPVVPADGFARLIGILVLCLMVVVLIQRLRPAWVAVAAERRRIAWPLGWLAGVTTMLSNAAGPITTVYLLACRLPKMEFVGTGAWFYLAVNVFKVPLSSQLGLITPDSLLLNLLMAPLVVVSVFFARWLLHRVNQQVFEWLMLLFTVAGAVRLIVS